MNISLIAHAQTPARGTSRQPPRAGQGGSVHGSSRIALQQQKTKNRFQAPTHFGGVCGGVPISGPPTNPPRARALKRKRVEVHSEVTR
jgi:hypothetical protein